MVLLDFLKTRIQLKLQICFWEISDDSLQKIIKYCFIFTTHAPRFLETVPVNVTDNTLIHCLSSFNCFPFLLIAICIYGTGCCSGICINEAGTVRTYFGKVVPFRLEIWISQTILHRSSRRQRHSHLITREYDKQKPPTTGLSAKRCRSFPFLLKASSSKQAIGRDLKDQNTIIASF